MAGQADDMGGRQISHVSSWLLHTYHCSSQSCQIHTPGREQTYCWLGTLQSACASTHVLQFKQGSQMPKAGQLDANFNLPVRLGQLSLLSFSIFCKLLESTNTQTKLNEPLRIDYRGSSLSHRAFILSTASYSLCGSKALCASILELDLGDGSAGVGTLVAKDRP